MSTASRENAGGIADEQIKSVPQSRATRESIRQEACWLVRNVSRRSPLSRDRVEQLGRQVLERSGHGRRYLGFAMVAASNAFWQEQFGATPFAERLLLLPHCLRDRSRCAGTYSPVGLDCDGCGACLLSEFKGEAEALGYHVLIAEGTPAVVQVVLSGRARAVLGVACLDSLEEAFQGVVQLGIPHVAVPLLQDGCGDTVAEPEVIRHWLHVSRGPAATRTRSYIPLLRAANSLFERSRLQKTIEDGAGQGGKDDAMNHTGKVAVEWLLRGGKRFRPFVTLASYAALARGREALEPDADLDDGFPGDVRRTAVAIEALHKASLVHDDIEDDDGYRYGKPTLHREHGVGTALNVGDYLIGLGYRLIGSVQRGSGDGCAADILAHLADSHLKLCRGQGAELLWQTQDGSRVRADEVQAVYALKTAPAFEAAMYAGLRLASAREEGRWAGEEEFRGGPPDDVRRFCRYLGAAYQVMNDLEDWDGDGGNKVVSGRDAVSGRPTMLRAFALDAAGEEIAAELRRLPGADLSETEKLARVREIYEELGVFEKACRLVRKYRDMALRRADQVRWESLGELMRFVVETVL